MSVREPISPSFSDNDSNSRATDRNPRTYVPYETNGKEDPASIGPSLAFVQILVLISGNKPDE